MVTVATVEQAGDGLVVHLRQDPARVDLEHLEELHAKDCNDLLKRIARPDVTVTMPNV
ncbi:MAG TPA: hypothetical protein VFD73_11360 [Gemmatimonadales bacterium]|nr:hypothetical protein [Gemmatimonadales bacterium]